MQDLNGFSIAGKARILIALLSAIAFSVLPSRGEDAENGVTLKNWTLYGSAKVGGAQWHRSKWYKKDVRVDTAGATDTVYVLDTIPVNRLFMDLQYNSFFGARAKTEKLGFKFELGWVPTVQELSINAQGTDVSVSQKRRDALRLRSLYGEWFINDEVTLTVGQADALSNFSSSNQIFFNDAGLSYSGALSTGRRPLVKIAYDNQRKETLPWKAEFAIIKPDTFIVALQHAPAAEERVPKLEAAGELGFKLNDLFGFRSKVVAGFHQYDLVIDRGQFSDISKDSAHQTVGTRLFAGSLDLDVWKTTTSVSYSWGKNLSAYGVWMGDPDGSRLDPNIDVFFPVWGASDTSSTALRHLTNAYTSMGTLVFNVHPLTWFALEAGGGMVVGRHESVDRQAQEKSTLNLMSRKAYYVNAQFAFLDSHFFIVPELSYSDFGGSAGRWLATGLKLQMDM